MTGEPVYSNDGIEIRQRGERYSVRYDAGTHMIVMREDEISPSEAAEAMSGTEGAVNVLFRLQRRLIALGIDPYKTNV